MIAIQLKQTTVAALEALYSSDKKWGEFYQGDKYRGDLEATLFTEVLQNPCPDSLAALASFQNEKLAWLAVRDEVQGMRLRPSEHIADRLNQLSKHEVVAGIQKLETELATSQKADVNQADEYGFPNDFSSPATAVILHKLSLAHDALAYVEQRNSGIPHVAAMLGYDIGGCKIPQRKIQTANQFSEDEKVREFCGADQPLHRQLATA